MVTNGTKDKIGTGSQDSSHIYDMTFDIHSNSCTRRESLHVKLYFWISSPSVNPRVPTTNVYEKSLEDFKFIYVRDLIADYYYYYYFIIFFIFFLFPRPFPGTGGSAFFVSLSALGWLLLGWHLVLATILTSGCPSLSTFEIYLAREISG